MVVTRSSSKNQTNPQTHIGVRRARPRRLIANYDDIDPISMESISSLPPLRLFTLRESNHKKYGYDSYAWIKWISHHSLHPITRAPLGADAVWACYNAAKRSVANDKDAPAQVKRCIEKLDTPLKVHYLTVLSFRPTRWTMLLFVSPLYELRSIHVNVSLAYSNLVNITYDVVRRKLRSSNTPTPPQGVPKCVRLTAPWALGGRWFAMGSDDDAIRAVVDLQEHERNEPAHEENDSESMSSLEDDSSESEWSEVD